MPKTKKHLSRRRSRLRIGGGPDTDELYKMEEGRVYGQNVTSPHTYNPANIPVSPRSNFPTPQANAKDFYDGVSSGLAEKERLENKYSRDKERERQARQYKESLENTNSATASNVFNQQRPEIENDIREYTEAEMAPFTYGLDEKGGRKSKRRKGRKSKRRKGRKSRKY
jgi:hypothetical protein